MDEKDIHIAGLTIREDGEDQLHLASSVGVPRNVTFTEDNADMDNQNITLLGVT